MHALQAAFKVFLEVRVGLRRRTPPGEDDVIIAGLRIFLRNLADGVLQTPPDSVAQDRMAYFFGDCETEPWAFGLAWRRRHAVLAGGLRPCLEHKCDILAASPTPDAQKILPILEGCELHGMGPSLAASGR